MSKLKERSILKVKVLASEEATKLDQTTKERIPAKTKEGEKLYQIYVEVSGERELPNGKLVKTTEIETIKSLFPLNEGTHWLEAQVYRMDKATYFRAIAEIMPIIEKKNNEKA